MSTAAFPTMLSINLRTSWKVLGTWVVAIGALVFLTTLSISGIYDTQAKIDSYAASIGSGDALVFLNGRVAGIDTLGGVIANEFGFVASFAIPLMSISLVTRLTRKDEEQGRLEALLSGRIGRSAPVLTAVVVASLALLLTGLALLAGLLSAGVSTAEAVMYAVSLAALGFVFAGLAALVSQVVEHSRGVYAVSLAVLVLAYLLRGTGDVLENAITWLSPLGWQEKMRAFGDDPRWWPVVIPVGLGLLLVASAVAVSRRRDLGRAIFTRSGTTPTASAFLRTPLGMAVRLHRGSIIGWTVGAVVISATFGSLTQPMIDAVAGNPALAEAMGASGQAGIELVLAISALFLALLTGAYIVQAIGILRAEETSGRLETRLAGPWGRWAWLGIHLAVVLVGLVIVALLGGIALWISTVWSTGEEVVVPVTEAVAAFLPAVLVLGGVALVLFGLLPRAQPVAWVIYGLVAVGAYLGEPLDVPDSVLAFSPFHHVGNPPQGDLDVAGLVWLSAVALVLAVVAFVGFRRRGIPAG